MDALKNMILLSALTCFCLVSVPSPSLADGFLEQLTGTWVGKGWARQEPNTAKEAIRCRLTNKTEARSGTLFANGKCAAAGKSFKINGQIQPLSGGKRYQGRWTNPDGIGSIPVSGRRQENKLTLSFTANLPDDKGQVTGQIIWIVDENIVKLSSTGAFAKTGQSGELGQILFTRR